MDILLLYLPYPLMLCNRFLCGALGISSATIRETAVQSYLPENMRARINAFFNMVFADRKCGIPDGSGSTGTDHVLPVGNSAARDDRTYRHVSADLPSGKRKPPRIRGGPKRRVVLINLLAVLSQRFNLRHRRTACRRLSLDESCPDLRPAERDVVHQRIQNDVSAFSKLIALLTDRGKRWF